GRIWVESAGLNRGSKFSFALPVLYIPADQGVKENTLTEAFPMRRLVVVIEDSVNFSAYLAERLGLEGCIVEAMTFEYGTPEHVAQIMPSLIILDIFKGDVQLGWSTLTLLKQHPATRDIPVIICTILQQSERIWQLGASSYVAKPIDEKFLLSEIGRLTDTPVRRIMVVDDDPIVRMMLTDSLAGYEVEAVPDGQR